MSGLIAAVVDGGAFPLVVDGFFIALTAVPEPVQQGYHDKDTADRVTGPKKHVGESERRQATQRMLDCRELTRNRRGWCKRCS